ncbi:hypothetical protein OC846_000252 [Tilletia horrida]|uniref:F-box domain-containing protein n=1 Tax=Tilletia horrida TaxID=155126 RepID=A0AAN6GVF1_9BASI|nr:hypothetical protein OC846_000252 [Tilletia horrida]KAK0570341.1 hypothetical protein OC861_000084 [Tilletia horrida]
MFSAGSPLMRTKELLLEGGWRRSPHPDWESDRGYDEADDEACFLHDPSDGIAFFDKLPLELSVHIFRHLPDVRDLIAVSQVCRTWYRLVRQYNGLWQAVYLQMPGWSIRPDTRTVLQRWARELESNRYPSSSGSDYQDQPYLHGSDHFSAPLAPLPYISLAPPPLGSLTRSRGRKSWIASHLPDLSSLSLGGGSAGGGTGSSSRASSHSRNSSWDIASNVRSRVLSGAASMAQSASEQLQRRRRKSVHVDATTSHFLRPDEPSDHPASPASLSRTLPTSPSPLRLQLAEETAGSSREDALSFGDKEQPARKAAANPRSAQSNINERALQEHRRIQSSLPASPQNDHFDDLDWRRLCIARWTLDRRWGIPIPPRPVSEGVVLTRMLSRSSSFGNDEAFYRPVRTYLKGHENSIYCIRMDSTFFDGAGRIVSGSRDRTIKVWNRGTGECVHTLTGHVRSVLCLQYDDELLVSGSSDHSILVWDFTFGCKVRRSFCQVAPVELTKTPKVIARLQGHEDSVLNIAMNDNYIVSCGKEKMVRVWDRITGAQVRQFSEHHTAVNGLALSGDMAVSASGDPTFYIWDVNDNSMTRRVLSEQPEGLACVVAQGNTVATGSKPTIKVWDARTGQCKQTLTGHTKMVRALAYDARRSVLVSGGYDFVVLCWHVPPVDSSDWNPVDDRADGLTTPRIRLPSRQNSASQTPKLGLTDASPTPSYPFPSSSSTSIPSDLAQSSFRFADSALPLHLGPGPATPSAEFRDHSGRVLSLAVDGTHLVSASDDQRICVRNFAVALPGDSFTSADLEIVGGGDQLCT